MKLNVVELAQKDFKSTVQRDLMPTVKKSAADDGIDVLGSNVLCAVYIAPEKTSGGIIRPEGHIHQDIHQGKVGLILKMGDMAFKFDGPFEYKGKSPKIGDYVMYRASDAANKLGLCGFSCVLVDSSLIRMVVGNPAIIY